MKKYIPFDFLAVLLGICLLAACSKDDNPEPSGVIPDSVDLDLNVNWASCNLGAEKPEALEPGDDVANKELGGNWRMPTKAEWVELIDNCTWTWEAPAAFLSVPLNKSNPGPRNTFTSVESGISALPFSTLEIKLFHPNTDVCFARANI